MKSKQEIINTALDECNEALEDIGITKMPPYVPLAVAALELLGDIRDAAVLIAMKPATEVTVNLGGMAVQSERTLGKSLAHLMLPERF